MSAQVGRALGGSRSRRTDGEDVDGDGEDEVEEERDVALRVVALLAAEQPVEDGGEEAGQPGLDGVSGRGDHHHSEDDREQLPARRQRLGEEEGGEEGQVAVVDQQRRGAHVGVGDHAEEAEDEEERHREHRGAAQPVEHRLVVLGRPDALLEASVHQVGRGHRDDQHDGHADRVARGAAEAVGGDGAPVDRGLVGRAHVLVRRVQDEAEGRRAEQYCKEDDAHALDKQPKLTENFRDVLEAAFRESKKKTWFQQPLCAFLGGQSGRERLSSRGLLPCLHRIEKLIDHAYDLGTAGEATDSGSIHNSSHQNEVITRGRP